MKKLMLVFGIFAFVAVAGASAQCTKSASACCAKKSSTTSASTAVGSGEMVKKVANTSETKAACCAKGSEAKSCKKDASACHGGTSKVTDAAAPANKSAVKIVRQEENASTTTANDEK
jgi:hypothetical protein